MAGHSKWANIQHRKKAQDAKRGKLFTRLIREIVVAAKAGGNLGQSGSVAYMFDNVGVLLYSPDHDEDTIMEAALEAGAEDVVVADDGSIEVITAPDEYVAVKQAMTDAGLEPEESDLTMRASTSAELDVDTAQQVLRLVDLLENSDDVQEVYYNAEIPEQAYEAQA